MKKIVFYSLLSLSLVGCATETSRIENPTKVDAFKTVYQGEKFPVVAGGFYDQGMAIDSPYQRETMFIKVERAPEASLNKGIVAYSQTEDMAARLQSLTSEDAVLSALLAETQRFTLMNGASTNPATTSQYLVSGAVTSVDSTLGGRKIMSDLLDFGSEEVVTVKVVLNVTDRKNSGIVFTTEGEVNYRLAPSEVAAFKHEQLDARALNRKILHLAMKDGVNNLALAVDQGRLKL